MYCKYKIAVIIPFFDGDKFLASCIKSIESQKKYPLDNIRIYLIDNSYSPSKKARDYLTSLHYIYVRTKSGLGFGRACNLGMSIAMKKKTDFFIVLNQDTILNDFMIFELLRAYRSDEKVKLISPYIYDYEINQPMEMVLKSFLFRNDYFHKDYNNKTLKEIYIIENIGAVCLLIPTVIFLDHPIFDPVFHMYNEDIDFYRRMRFQKINLYLSTTSIIHHYTGMRKARENLKFSKFKNYHSKNSKIFYSIRHKNNFTDILFFIAVSFKRDVVQFGLFYGLSTTTKRIYLSIKKYNYLRYNSRKLILKKVKKFIKNDKLP